MIIFLIAGTVRLGRIVWARMHKAHLRFSGRVVM